MRYEQAVRSHHADKSYYADHGQGNQQTHTSRQPQDPLDITNRDLYRFSSLLTRTYRLMTRQIRLHRLIPHHRLPGPYPLDPLHIHEAHISTCSALLFHLCSTSTAVPLFLLPLYPTHLHSGATHTIPNSHHPLSSDDDSIIAL